MNGEPKKSAKQMIYEYVGEVLERKWDYETKAIQNAKLSVLETLCSRCGYMDIFFKIKNRRAALSAIPEERWWDK